MESTEEQKIFEKIIREAWKNSEFKAELMNSPVEAIQNLTGKTLIIPEDKTFVVKDQSDASIIYFNIPAEPDMDDLELKEDQLDIVAGGTQDPPIIITDGASQIADLLGDG